VPLFTLYKRIAAFHIREIVKSAQVNSYLFTSAELSHDVPAFCMAQIDEKLSIPGAVPGDLVLLMLETTILGMIFGVLYWKLGIECAVLTHFTFDAMASSLIGPAYISDNPIVQVVVLVGLLILGVIAWFILKRTWRKDV